MGNTMKTYEELDSLFRKSRQAYLVTALPFCNEAVILYANEAAAALLGVEQNTLSGLTAGRVGLAGDAAAESAGNVESIGNTEHKDNAERTDGTELAGNAEGAGGIEHTGSAENAGG